MIELDNILQMCIDVFGVNPKKRNRKLLYVSCRFAFYYYSKKLTNYTLDQIGDHLGYDHASVIHGCSKYENRRRNYTEHAKLFADIEILINNYIENKDVEMGDDLNFYELKINIINKKLILEQNKNAQLKHRLNKLRNDIPQEVIELLFETNENEVNNFVTNKVIPQLRAYRHYNKKETA